LVELILVLFVDAGGDFMSLPEFENGRYQAITWFNVHKQPEWGKLPVDLREEIEVVSQVLPFRTNQYVTSRLIDWRKVPEDPIYQLNFPQRGMLATEDYEVIRDLLWEGSSREALKENVSEIRKRMNPHPDGQLSHNIPELKGVRLRGIQHKYRETVLFFPAQGQTCHAYCSYCFRWPQFIGNMDVKFRARHADELLAYLETQPEVTDLLITGGDPLVMKTSLLKKYLDPVLNADLAHVQTIRIGTKALSYWPARFIHDPDSDDLLRFFEQIVARGKHLALMAHVSHPVELRTEWVREAIRRIRSTGAEIRMQAPVAKHVNNRAEAWSDLWTEAVKLGLIPYYMFVERNTGPNHYFRIPLHKAYQIYREGIREVSGLARTVRGPSMSAFPGKVHVLGVSQIGKDKVFVLQLLQGRDPNWVGRPFFAKFDPDAYWFDQLEPAFGKKRYFFERDQDAWAVSTVA
jgi:KamA family protein